MARATRERVGLRPVSTDTEERSKTVRHAYRRGFRRFVGPSDLSLPEGAVRIEERANEYVARGRPPVPRRTVGSPSELEGALAVARNEGAVAISWTGDRVIPLENALAGTSGSFEIWVDAARARDVPALLGALEHGADFVVVDVDSPAEVDALEALLDAEGRTPVVWSEATVTAVRPVGLGDRVLLDTTSLLAPTEGLAVGSSAAALFLVLSEAVGSQFTRPRRFRVNAGGPHSYVLMADGTTRYLSELEPGEELLAVDVGGASRGVRLGRLKIERRPLALVEASLGASRATVFLQEAETVRVSASDGARPVTDLVVGTVIRALVLPAARHLGRTVDETIEER